MARNIYIVDVTDSERAKLERIRQRLRQLDVASMAKVAIGDVINLEKGRLINGSRRERILKALGLLEEGGNGHVQ